MQLEFDIYPNRANTVKMSLTDNGQVINHFAITRLSVYVGSRLFDSNISPELFDLTHSNYLIFNPALASPVLAPAKYSCRLVVYDAGEFALGFIWPGAFVLNMLDEPD